MRVLPYLCRRTCSTLDSFRCTKLTMSSTLSRLSGFAWEGGEEKGEGGRVRRRGGKGMRGWLRERGEVGDEGAG